MGIENHKTGELTRTVNRNFLWLCFIVYHANLLLVLFYKCTEVQHKMNFKVESTATSTETNNYKMELQDPIQHQTV